MIKNKYSNGGDGMFFFHKKTKHPALQIAHDDKTWTNRRYTHHPNRLSDYELDNQLSTAECPVYCSKKVYVDNLYTRGHPYKIKTYKKKR